MFLGNISEANLKVAELTAGSGVAIRLDPMQEHNLAEQFNVSDGKAVLLDGGGATIAWPSALTAFSVRNGARLCVVNAVLDGRREGGAVHGQGAGTWLKFENVTIKNCADSRTVQGQCKVGYCDDRRAVTLQEGARMDCTGCEFRHNRAMNGAALSATGQGTHMQGTKCVFKLNGDYSHNWGQFYQGGALYLSNGASIAGSDECPRFRPRGTHQSASHSLSFVCSSLFPTEPHRP